MKPVTDRSKGNTVPSAADQAAAGEPTAQSPLRGIVLKVLSVCCFVVMSAMLKATATVPAGEMVFFRSFFALLPVLGFLLWRGTLRNAFSTKRPVGHVVRGLVG
ncbi:MAG: EamA/RhaT family transporter, partial [Alphaproteobacteria bacterium]